MKTKQFNELQRQADVIEQAAKHKMVNDAVDLFTETVALETTDIDAEPAKWHRLYNKECDLFQLLAKMDDQQREEYGRRIKSVSSVDKHFKFTFETEDAYNSAKRTGYIDTFDIVRLVVKDTKGYQIDYPVKSREEYEKQLAIIARDNSELIKAYQSQHYYDISERY